MQSCGNPVPGAKSSVFGTAQTYFFNATADCTPNDAQQQAQQRYAEITSHAMKLHATMPGDLILGVTTPLQVRGTGTDLDQIYLPRLVTRRMSAESGFTMEVEAQNTTPELEDAVTSDG